jgi:hypothetical protein
MTGNEMCDLSKDEFTKRTPGYEGDILFEHLVILQQDVSERGTPEGVISDQPVDFSHQQRVSPTLNCYQPYNPTTDLYQPPAHLYQQFNTLPLYAGEQYTNQFNGYHHLQHAAVQPFVPIPQPLSYFRPHYSVSNFCNHCHILLSFSMVDFLVVVDLF